jgi:hypothetical protein
MVSIIIILLLAEVVLLSTLKEAHCNPKVIDLTFIQAIRSFTKITGRFLGFKIDQLDKKKNHLFNKAKFNVQSSNFLEIKNFSYLF